MRPPPPVSAEGESTKFPRIRYPLARLQGVRLHKTVKLPLCITETAGVICRSYGGDVNLPALDPDFAKHADMSQFKCVMRIKNKWNPSAGTRFRSWLRYCATNQKVASSIPDEVIGFFNWRNPSSRTMALGSTQSLTDMSTRNLPGGKGRPAPKADNLTATCEPIV
jgi:hypothetical protein